MMLSDYHVHTTYCDGKSTAEETVLSAIAKGLGELGFSGHSYIPFDDSYCMSLENTKKYIAEISALKEKYADKIKIFCGIEQDYFSPEVTDAYDYVIGSVHHIKIGNDYPAIDHTKDNFIAYAEKYYGGDYYAFAESYYELAGDVAEKMHPDIIGHFDLITKFNEGNCLFDTSHPRYVAAWKAAADKLLPYGIPFEINTGAITRGYRTLPYPENSIVDYIASKGGSFILSSDSHCADTLCYGFDKLKHTNVKSSLFV